MEEEKLAMNYNRPMLQRRCLSLTLLSLMVFSNLGLSLFVLIDGLCHSWAWVAVNVITCAFVVRKTPNDCLRAAFGSWQDLTRNASAVLVDKDGLVFNAAEFRHGHILWSEIERMQPWTLEHRSLANRLFKAPVVTKDKGIAIVFKENMLLKRRPWMRILFTRREAAEGPGKWMFLPESLMEVPADELMHRINRFYTAQVRGPV